MTDEMIAELVRLAGNLAQEIAGAPDGLMAGVLARFRNTLRDELTEALGLQVAELVADEFMNTVAECKKAIEGPAGCESVTLQ
jgi:hypothetical protein